MGDDASLKEVTDALATAGVPANDIDVFVQQVASLNEVVPAGALITTPTPLADAKEDDGTVSAATDKQSRLTNWRITTFTLAQSLISVDNTDGANADMLFIDHDQLDAEPPIFGDARPAFDTLYGRINTTTDKDVAQRTADIETYLADHGVHYAAGPVSVIDVYAHDTLDPQAYSFIGHTGIAIDNGSDLLFIEKLAFDAPYRAISFADRAALKDYLMGMYDSSEGQDYGAPIIFDNGKPIDA